MAKKVFVKKSGGKWFVEPNTRIKQPSVFNQNEWFEFDISDKECLLRPQHEEKKKYEDGDIVAFISAQFFPDENIVGAGAELTEIRIAGVWKNDEYFEKYPEARPRVGELDKLMKYIPPMTVDDTGFSIDKDTWYYLLLLMKQGKQVLLSGASGSGKTELPMYVINYLNKLPNVTPRTLSIFDMAVSNPEANFKGQMHMHNGNTEFVYSRFAKTIQQPNQVILLDEVNRGDLDVQNMLMPLFDGRRTLFIERGETEEIKAHPTTVFWATANVGHEFAGTNMIDIAFLQRFHVVEIPFPVEEDEVKVLMKRSNVDKVDAEKLVKLAKKVRDNNAVKPISTRQLIFTADLVHAGYTLRKAVEMSILTQYPTDAFSGGDRGIIKSYMMQL